MKTWIFCGVSFLLGGAIVGAIAMKLLVATWQSEVLVQNDIYARHIQLVTDEDIESLVKSSCIALQAGLDNYAMLGDSFWATDDPFYPEAMVQEINSKAQAYVESQTVCKRS